MAFTRPPITVADATFSASGAINWNAGYTVAGATVGGIPYCPTATSEATSAGFTFDGSTLALAMGAITTAIGPQTWTETRNNAAITFPGLKYVITDTASAAGSLALQILGGAAGTTVLAQVSNVGALIVGGAITSNGGNLQIVSTAAFLWSSGTNFQTPSDGVITLYNNGNSSFGRLQFGGTTASFPAIKRNLTALNVRLADDSADAPITAAAATLSGTLTLTPAISMLSTGGAPTVGELVLVAGTKTVNTTAATSTCKVFAQRKTAGGTVGFASTYTINAGVSFTLNSDNVLDTSTYEWWIVEAR